MAQQQAFSQDLSSPGLLPGEQRMSRRAILLRLAGFTLAGGSITSFITACGSPANTSPASQIDAPSASHSDAFSASQPPTSSSHSKALYTYQGHSASVNAVAWSPDGKRIASGSNDHTVQVWDAANGEHVFIYRGHADHVNAVPWSPDGKRIASGSDDDRVQVWDAANGGHVFTYRGHADAVWGGAWASDGTRIVS